MSKGLDNFFAPSRLYAVAGASADPSRFGHKVFAWYVDRGLPVTPINPRPGMSILGYRAVPTLSEFVKSTAVGTNTNTNTNDNDNDNTNSHKNHLALSVVTPPQVSLQIMHEAKLLNNNNNTTANNNSDNNNNIIKAVWFQEGSFNNQVLQAAEEAGIETIIAYNDCILVQGDTYLKASKAKM